MSMDYICPKCGYENIDVAESLPSDVSTTVEHSCSECEEVILIGWIAEVEVRGVKNDNNYKTII